MRRLAAVLVFVLSCDPVSAPETFSTPEPPPESPSPGEVDLNTESSSHPVVDDIEVTPSHPEWMAGDTLMVRAVARDSTGARVDSFDIKWQSLNTAIASVGSEQDTLGMVDGVELGRTGIAIYVQEGDNATVRHAHAFVDEPIPSDNKRPSLDSLALSSDTIRTGEKVNVTVGASDAGAGVNRVIVGFRPAGEDTDTFTSQTNYNESGTWHEGTWIMGAEADRLLEMGPAGEWELSLYISDRCELPRTCPVDSSDHVVSLEPDSLRALGWPASVTIEP